MDTQVVDVREVSLAVLAQPDRPPAMDAALRRLLESLDDPDGVISAFSSFV